MNCDLAGLALRAASQIDHPVKANRALYAHSLRELASHVQMVREGKATLEEFAACYCLAPAAPKVTK